MQSDQLAGRVALVTGGGRGIGRAVSELLASHGAAVAVNYRRDKDAADETVATIETARGRAIAVAAAVEDPDADAAMVERIGVELGPVDVLVCNAGVASRGRPVADTDPDEVVRLFMVHAAGSHFLSRLVVREMRRCRRGDIAMISSVASSKLNPGGAPYNMAKAAMEALAFTLAKEERPNGIHVNVVAPGIVETDMGIRLARAITGDAELTDLRSLDGNYPFGRACQPLDVANVVLWLCTEGAGYVTGQRIECDGGGPLSGDAPF